MDNLVEVIVALDGTITEVPYTAEQIAEVQANRLINEAKHAAKAKAEADKATAQAKLAELGLTTDDLKALGL
tara:strand:+ start:857 stop:1072 length:216 start_codon:yes stop_codon:yes gene_type:complete